MWNVCAFSLALCVCVLCLHIRIKSLKVQFLAIFELWTIYKRRNHYSKITIRNIASCRLNSVGIDEHLLCVSFTLQTQSLSLISRSCRIFAALFDSLSVPPFAISFYQLVALGISLYLLRTSVFVFFSHLPRILLLFCCVFWNHLGKCQIWATYTTAKWVCFEQNILLFCWYSVFFLLLLLQMITFQAWNSVSCRDMIRRHRMCYESDSDWCICGFWAFAWPSESYRVW